MCQKQLRVYLHSQCGADQINDSTELIAVEIHGYQEKHLSKGSRHTRNATTAKRKSSFPMEIKVRLLESLKTKEASSHLSK